MEESRDGDTRERIPAARARSPARRLSCHDSGIQSAKAQRRGLGGKFVWGYVSRLVVPFNARDIFTHRVL